MGGDRGCHHGLSFQASRRQQGEKHATRDRHVFLDYHYIGLASIDNNPHQERARIIAIAKCKQKSASNLSRIHEWLWANRIFVRFEQILRLAL